MRVIEFTGLPGGGKTTMCHSLFSEHDMIGKGIYTIDSIKANRMSNKTRQKGVAGALDRLRTMWQPYRQRSLDYHYLRAHRGLLEEAIVDRSELLIEVLDATSHLPEASKMWARTEFLRNLADHEFAKRYLDEGDVLWGEGGEGFCRGVVNTYWHYEGSDVEQRISRYVSLCPPIDVLVYVDVDPRVALRRSKERLLKHPIYIGKTDEVILQMFERYRRVDEMGKRAFLTHGTRTIEIDTTDGDVGLAAHECAEKLRSAGLRL